MNYRRKIRQSRLEYSYRNSIQYKITPLFLIFVLILISGCVNKEITEKNITFSNNNTSENRFSNNNFVKIILSNSNKKIIIQVENDTFSASSNNKSIAFINKSLICDRTYKNGTKIYIKLENYNITYQINYSIFCNRQYINLSNFNPVNFNNNSSSKQWYKIKVIDGVTNCKLDGDIFENCDNNEFDFIGTVKDGILTTDKNLTIGQKICIITNLSSCFKYYENFSLYRETTINNSDTIIFHIHPEKFMYYGDLMNFIRPNDVINFVNENRKYIDKKTEINERIEKLSDILYSDIRYRWDFNNIWKTPGESLDENSGDCEEFATTLLSSIKAYNNSLDCFNLIVPGHVTTICKFKNNPCDTVEIFDMGHTYIRTAMCNYMNNYDKKKKAYSLIYNYFSDYGLPLNGFYAYAAFNETNVTEFNSNEEFIEWIVNM